MPPWNRRLTLAAVVLVAAAGPAGAANPLEPGAVAAPEPKPHAVRITFPDASSIPYGTTPVCVEAAAGTPATVFRLVGRDANGRDRWQRLDRDDAGRISFDAGRDLGPEVLRATAGSGPDAASVTVQTDFEPPVDATVAAGLYVDTSVSRDGGALDAPLGPGLFTGCEYAGRPCEVIGIDPVLPEGTLYLSVLVDVSGSMASLKEQLATSLDAFLAGVDPSRYRVAFRVLEFSEMSLVRDEQRPVEEIEDQVLRGHPRDREEGYTEDLEEVRLRVRQSQPGGATALFAAIANEMQFLRTRQAREQQRGRRVAHAIVVYSDGVDTSREGEWMANFALHLASTSSIPVYPVLVAGGIRGTYGGKYAALGSESGGMAFTTGEGLPKTLAAISRRLVERYRIWFAPQPEADRKKPHRIRFTTSEGIELSYPSYWYPPPPVARVALSVFGDEGARYREKLSAMEAVGDSGTPRDADRLFEAFRDELLRWAKEARVEAIRATPLFVVEQRLGLFGSEPSLAAGLTGGMYQYYRSAAFRAVFAACRRALLLGDAKEQRDGIKLLESVAWYLRDGPYSIRHLMDPVLTAFRHPEFPAPDALKRRAEPLGGISLEEARRCRPTADPATISPPTGGA